METNQSKNNLSGKKLEDVLIILVKHRISIFLNVLIVTILAIIISLLLELRYTATTSVIPPKKTEGLFGDIGGFSSTISGISKMLSGRIGNVSEETYNYLIILQSRTASEKMINHFNLREVYEFDEDAYFEKIIKELEGNVDFTIEDEGNLVISVTDKSPQRAADMANYYVDILNEISTNLSVKEAKSNRQFIEKRFIQLQNDIVSVEDSLRIFSKQYNVLEMEEQMKAAITVAAELKAQLEMAKIEKELVLINFGEGSPLFTQAELKLSMLQEQLSELKFGEEKSIRSSINLFLPFEKVPEIGVEYIRLMRDYEIQNKILEFIYPLYEQAKIEEQKNIPVVLVVDKAIPPERKSSPKRAIIVIAAFLLSMFFSIIYSILIESYGELKNDDIRYRKIKEGIIEPLKKFIRFRK